MTWNVNLLLNLRIQYLALYIPSYTSDVMARFPGSVHDSRICKISSAGLYSKCLLNG